MTRIVRSTEAGVVIDPSGKANGRGSYLCDQRACWEKALSGRLLDKALLIEISEDDRKRLTRSMPPA